MGLIREVYKKMLDEEEPQKFSLGEALDKMLEEKDDNLSKGELKEKIKKITDSFNKSGKIIEELD